MVNNFYPTMAHKYKSAVFDYFILSEAEKSFICKCKVKVDIEECDEKDKQFYWRKALFTFKSI